MTSPMKLTALLVCLVVWMGWGNSQWYGNKLQWEIYGESDSTLLTSRIFYYKHKSDTSFCRYTFAPESYWKANSVIELYFSGFENLNLIAQKEYLENISLIKDMDCYSSRKEMELKRRLNDSTTLNPEENK